MKRELTVLKRRRALLQNTLRLAESFCNIQEDVLTYKNCTQTYYILSEKITASSTEGNSFSVWSRLIEYCEQHKYFNDFITGTAISAENVAAHDFQTFYFTAHLEKAVRSKYLHKRPAGRYACKYIRSSYDNLAQECATFYNELQAQGIITSGALYQSDISSYLTETNSEEYLMLLEMKVE